MVSPDMRQSTFEFSAIISQLISVSIMIYSIVVFPLVISTFNRKWLRNYKYWKKTFAITLLVTIILLLILRLYVADHPTIYIYMIFIPIYSLCLYRLLLIIFFKLTQRMPVDTSNIYESQRVPFLDMCFDIIYLLLSVPFPLYVLTVLNP